jgi:hypothetical protein
MPASQERVVGQHDVVAQIATDEKIGDERDPQQPGHQVAERQAERAPGGERGSEFRRRMLFAS